MKIKPTNPPVLPEVCVVVGLSMKRIDMYIDHCGFVFTRFTLDGGVGHVLVLVFAAMRRHSALRAPAWVIERAGGHVTFSKLSS